MRLAILLPLPSLGVPSLDLGLLVIFKRPFFREAQRQSGGPLR
jgi:hypothetical protein